MNNSADCCKALQADLLKPTAPIMADYSADSSIQAIAQNNVDSNVATQAVSLLSCPSANSRNNCSMSNDATWSASYLRQLLCQHDVVQLHHNQTRCAACPLLCQEWGLHLYTPLHDSKIGETCYQVLSHCYTPPHDSKMGEAWGSWGRRNSSCSTPRWYSAASWVRVKRLSPVKMFQMQMRPP